ncbi:alpha/beta hydrolase-fold protein [Nocardioides sp. BP30]|uniref:alpha/beta hydrolase n=1 Tax=Nocardioides sp. BP30 TaxID=3036374 RepID=UPI0024687467|nr:alpha/beta hydrolase-fold protein [Nocardioides sp. BP30]WGL50960.1 alpha/beta hydrolase-fold protein [Nocardioides sp. BP30]
MLSRRTLLTAPLAVGVGGAAVFAGVQEGVLPGRARMHRALGWTGADGTIPDVAPGPIISGSFVSAARGGVRTGWSLIRPPRVAGKLPLVVTLHGRGGDHRTFVHELGGPQFLAQAVSRGVAPYAIASVDGGESYWHPHHGQDAGAMVTEELLPLLAEHDVETRTLGFHGWSMGGYGALRLAGLLGSRRVRGVAVASPALWVDASGVSPAGFSSAAEYDRYSVFDRQSDLAGIPVRVDIGREDPFYVAVRRYVAGFPASAHVRSTFEEGAHEAGYWRRMLPAELAFLGSTLAG